MKKILLTALLFQAVYSFSQSLVLHYSMDSMTSTTLPANILSNHGTGNAPIFSTSGVTGLATDKYAEFNYGQGLVSALALNNQNWNGAAISVWYKSTSSVEGTLVQGSFLGFGVRVLGNGKAQAFFNGTQSGAGNSTSKVNDGLWHHILAQTDGTKTYIYIDGVLENSKVEKFEKIPAPNTLATIYIGNAANNANDQKITGKIDDVKIYDNALNLSKIHELSLRKVLIPNANFKAYLTANTSINTNKDSEIQYSEAEAFTGRIDCSSLTINDLTGIEAFTALTQLHCQYNQLTSLDLSLNKALTHLSCFNNLLTNLDLSANTALGALDFNNNKLTGLDVSANTLLYILAGVNNELISLDLSANPALTYLNCRQNRLTSLNLKNGSNTILTKANFNVVNNPNLTCIQVDDATWSTSNWTTKDNTASYNTNCNYTKGVHDAQMIRFTLYPNPVNNILTIHTDAILISNSIYDLSGSLVDTFYGNEFSVSHLKNGVYFITVQTQTGTAYHKFVKQ